MYRLFQDPNREELTCTPEWSTNGAEGVNKSVDNLFNGAKVDNSAFKVPKFQFSGSKPAPTGPGPFTVAVLPLPVEFKARVLAPVPVFSTPAARNHSRF